MTILSGHGEIWDCERLDEARQHFTFTQVVLAFTAAGFQVARKSPYRGWVTIAYQVLQNQSEGPGGPRACSARRCPGSVVACRWYPGVQRVFSRTRLVTGSHSCCHSLNRRRRRFRGFGSVRALSPTPIAWADCDVLNPCRLRRCTAVNTAAEPQQLSILSRLRRNQPSVTAFKYASGAS
jgi:hypothetical protein